MKESKKLYFLFLTVFSIMVVAVFLMSDNSNLDVLSLTNNRPTEIDMNFIPAKVEKVIDGDTIKVIINGKSTTVRMIGVDTPETVHPKKPVEYYGKEASEFTKKSLTNKTVYLQKDVSDTDRYGRMLSYIWINQPSRLEPGKEEVKNNMFNAILISKGYGQVVTFPPDIKYTEWFKDFQQSPREKKIGLWSNPKAKNINSSPVKSGKIKGNISKNGDKIYHVPGGKFYEKVKAEIYFNTEKEAEKAGFRKSKQ